MEQLLKFNLELKKKNILNISVITDFNCSVSERFEKLFSIYNLGHNKFYMLQELVNFGMELENINQNNDDFVLEQLSTFSNLYLPIVSKIKEVCFELNNQIINDLKLSYDNIIESDSYQDKIKIYKSIQIFSNVKNFYYIKPKEIPFDDFGIGIKIPNPNDKPLFKDIIDSFGIFSLPTLVLSKKMDWIWKPLNSNMINENSFYLKCVCDTNIEKLEIIVENNIETINKHNNLYNLIRNNNDKDNDNNNKDNNNDNEIDTVPSIALIKNILKQNNSGYNYDFMKKQVGENLLETNSTNDQFSQLLSNQKLNNNITNGKLPDLVVIDDDSFNLEINKNNYVNENKIIVEPDKNLLQENNDLEFNTQKNSNTKIIIEIDTENNISNKNESEEENEYQYENKNENVNDFDQQLTNTNTNTNTNTDIDTNTNKDIILEQNISNSTSNQTEQTNFSNLKKNKKNKKNKKKNNNIIITPL